MKYLTMVLVTATLVTLLLGVFVPASASAPAQSQPAATIQPLPAEVCNGQAQALAHALDVLEVTRDEAPLSDPVTGASGTGCQATVTGTGEEFASPDAVVNTLGAMLEEEGWTQDPMLAAGGPTGYGAGYRKGDQMCMADAQWWPDASANCPQDQPVSACQVTPEQQNYTVTLNCGVESPAGGTPVTTTAATTATLVPLQDAVATMDPQDVWQNFHELTQIPRPSHHEEQVRDFLVQFGQGLGLETLVDDVGNVLIRKPASPGLENRQGVVLQAHMDMVAQKTPDSTHDFLTDPIDAYVDGDWVVADGTTLGADDGIGVAIAMAVVQSPTLALGPIEALFTVNEEDGMDGALGLQPGWLQGDTLINLDWETEGVFAIGSAGGDYGNVDTTYAEAPAPESAAAYTVTVSGLQGGHSGMDINLGRGHATKLLVRLLSPAVDTYGLRVATIAGGTAANAIPTIASALVLVPNDQVDAFLAYVTQYEAIVQSELAATEPGLVVEATPAVPPATVMDEAAQRTVLDALYGTPQGVIRMSDTVSDLVETSTNMGIVAGADGELKVTCYPRSSVDTELDDINQMIASVWDLAGIDVAFSGRFAGWNPNPDSPILLLMQDVYQEMYAQQPEVTAIHAGLECGTIVSKYPGMDAISIGPTLLDVHTPNERVQISTVKKLNDFLLETLQQIPAEATTGGSAQTPDEKPTLTPIEDVHQDLYGRGPNARYSRGARTS